MDAFLVWLQNLPPFLWVAESDSIWGYAFLLFVHAIGMGLTAGLALVVSLRLLGVGSSIPVSSLRPLFGLFWIGFSLNLVSGSVLFATNATGHAHVLMMYVKLLLLALGLVVTRRLRVFVDGSTSDGVVPSRVRTTAVVCIALWLSVIVAGRMIAYAVESAGASLTPADPAPMASLR